MALDDENQAERDSQPDEEDESVAAVPAEKQRKASQAKSPPPDEDDEDDEDDEADDEDDEADDAEVEAEDEAVDDDLEHADRGRGAAARKSAAKSRSKAAPDDDDDDDDQDDDDDDDEELAAAARRRAARAARKRKRGKKRRSPPIPKTEAELATPSRAGSIMVWTVVGATLVLWLFARTACNFNPPQTEKPKLAELDVIAREPKGAAVEFEVRLREHRFAISEQLASASGKAVVAQAKQACGAGCTELEHGSVLCQGSLLERGADLAKVRVQCDVGGKVDYQLLSVVREQTAWKVSAREPSVAPPPIPTAAVPAPTGVVPPVGTAIPTLTAPPPTQPTPPTPAPPTP